MKRKSLLRFACAMLMAFAVLFFVSKSSPLYPINDWADANIYLSVGKGMTEGRVVYRDLYDHKGPLLFMLHAGCALISDSSFAGVFVMEVLLGGCFLYIALKFFELMGLRRTAWLAVAVLSVIAFTSYSFCEGDSAEEMGFPFIMGAIYGVTAFLKSGKDRMSAKSLITHGVLAGCVFWIKFTMIGLHAGLLLTVLIHQTTRGGWKGCLRTIGWLLAGFAVSTLPWILYFGLNGAIYDWLKVYLYDNLFLYSASESIGLWEKAKDIVKAGLDWLVHNLRYAVPIFVGLIGSLRMEKWQRLAVWLTAGLGALCSYIYYGLVLVPASAMGLAAMAGWIESRSLPRWLVPALCMLCIALTPALSKNVRPTEGVALGQSRDTTMQYRFAALINETPNATLLNYGFMDAGFYTAAGVTPQVKYFHRTNVPIQEMLDEQDRYIREGLCDYVVTRGMQPGSITEKYDLIATEKSPNFWYEFVHLYRLKSLANR